MASKITLDAMIPRDDFAVEADAEGEEEFEFDLFTGFPLTSLTKDSGVLHLLRKPDFQRETNHWTAEQTATFIASFLDGEVIPSLILWKSPSFIFVIDGGHRLSALRAWMQDDYGDGPLSQAFYGFDISQTQRRAANRVRKLIEHRIGRYSTLRNLLGTKAGTPEEKKRAGRLHTRVIAVQWIQGNADAAETSFFKINSQGTPLDETEGMLIRNRRKPIAIAARAIMRAGTGHKYWSAFAASQIQRIEQLSAHLFSLFFDPEIEQPLKTLDVPLGGTVSPVDALALLIEFLAIAGRSNGKYKSISEDEDDLTGDATIASLENATQIMDRITGNTAGSLGLHPAVYFYNERGKYSRFLFLGMGMLLTERVRSNDELFFKKFTCARAPVEKFLMENKSLIGIIVQNLSRRQRVPKIRDLLMYLVGQANTDAQAVSPVDTIAHLGLRGRIIDVVSAKTSSDFSDDTKSTIFVRKALDRALECPICGGKLDPRKSVSYDHVLRVRDGGLGDASNGDLVHPYCNSAIKN